MRIAVALPLATLVHGHKKKKTKSHNKHTHIKAINPHPRPAQNLHRPRRHHPNTRDQQRRNRPRLRRLIGINPQRPAPQRRCHDLAADGLIRRPGHIAAAFLVGRAGGARRAGILRRDDTRLIEEDLEENVGGAVAGGVMCGAADCGSGGAVWGFSIRPLFFFDRLFLTRGWGPT